MSQSKATIWMEQANEWNDENKNFYRNRQRLHSLAEKPLYIEQFIVAHVEQILTVSCVFVRLSVFVLLFCFVLFC